MLSAFCRFLRATLHPVLGKTTVLPMNNRLLLGAGIVLLIAALLVVYRGPSESGESGDSAVSSNRAQAPGALSKSRDSPAARSSRPPENPGTKGKSSLIYSGPTKLEEWTLEGKSNEKWEYAKGELWSTGEGTLARLIPTETRSRVRFKLDWQEDLRLHAIFFADDGSATQPDNGYSLVIRQGFIYVRKRWMSKQSGGSRNLGKSKFLPLGQDSGVELEFFFDRESGLIGLYANGERVQVWRDADTALMGQHNWFQFHSEDGFPVGISDIVFENWDGSLPDVPVGQPAFFDPNPDRIAELTPPQAWEPLERYRQEKARLREEYVRAADVADGPERTAARHAASQAIVRIQDEYNQALEQLPRAERVKTKAGFVINPYTGEELDVRGVPSDQRVWDPRTSKPDEIFRLP